MWHQHDHLGHSRGTFARAKELVREFLRGDQLESEHVPVKAQSRVDVLHPQHDLRETRDAAHAAMAVSIAARWTSWSRGVTENPGASSSPRPPVSATARRASVSTSGGGP